MHVNTRDAPVVCMHAHAYSGQRACMHVCIAVSETGKPSLVSHYSLATRHRNACTHVSILWSETHARTHAQTHTLLWKQDLYVADLLAVFIVL